MAALDAAERLDRIRLARTEQVGPITFRRLLQRFPTASEALEALPELAKRGGRSAPLRIPSRQDVLAELSRLQRLGGDMLVWGDAAYPPLLAAIEAPPPVLSWRGKLDLLARPGLAIVGARDASLNGRKLAGQFAEALGREGLAIVSGLARGIDAAAHRASLETGTIAVIAGGIDTIYPTENTALFHAIAGEGGLVLAEEPLGLRPMARHFPKRNRIVAGLSHAALVVEAALRSGSLITARLAGEMGRDVFAIPGSPLDTRAQGCNRLIRDGATLVQAPEELLADLAPAGIKALAGRLPPASTQGSLQLGWREEAEPAPRMDRPAPATVPTGAGFGHEELLQLLQLAPTPVDEIVRQCQLSPAAVAGLLLDLELAGRLQRHPGNSVSRIA